MQTILPVLLPQTVRVPFTRERWEMPDGDFLDLDWVRRGHARLAILSHGLEGSSRQSYIHALADALQAQGWDVLAWNFRGCSGEPNRLLRFYHSGETGDLRAVVERAAGQYGRIAVVGFSLGGNVTLKYLGEAPPPTAIVAGVGLSVPVDLASCALKLDARWDNQLYLRRFLSTMLRKIEAKARQFPNDLDVSELRKVRSFEVFDGRFTGPIHGFSSAAEYWARCSSRPVLRHITVPTLLLNARNDPFLTDECFPTEEAAHHRYFHLEAPTSGGHVGFLDLRQGIQPWWARRIVEFLGAAETGRPNAAPTQAGPRIEACDRR